MADWPDVDDGLDGDTARWELIHDGGGAREIQIVRSHTMVESGTVPTHGRGDMLGAAEAIARGAGESPAPRWWITPSGVTDKIDGPGGTQLPA
jgi:hypothetical protein